MPFNLQKVKGGYFVVSDKKKYSKKPIPKANAEAQMRLLYKVIKREKK